MPFNALNTNSICILFSLWQLWLNNAHISRYNTLKLPNPSPQCFNGGTVCWVACHPGWFRGLKDSQSFWISVQRDHLREMVGGGKREAQNVIIWSCHIMYIYVFSAHNIPHVGYVEQSEDSGSSNKEWCTEDGGVDVDVLHYSKRTHKQDSDCNRSDIDSACNCFCVIETFNLDPACGKCQEERQNLWKKRLIVRNHRLDRIICNPLLFIQWRLIRFRLSWS